MTIANIHGLSKIHDITHVHFPDVKVFKLALVSEIELTQFENAFQVKFESEVEWTKDCTVPSSNGGLWVFWEAYSVDEEESVSEEIDLDENINDLLIPISEEFAFRNAGHKCLERNIGYQLLETDVIVNNFVEGDFDFSQLEEALSEYDDAPKLSFLEEETTKTFSDFEPTGQGTDIQHWFGCVNCDLSSIEEMRVDVDADDEGELLQILIECISSIQLIKSEDLKVSLAQNLAEKLEWLDEDEFEDELVEYRNALKELPEELQEILMK